MAKIKNIREETEKVPSDIKDSSFVGDIYHLYGTCRFCQQERMLTYGTDNIPQEQVDKDATLSCTCEEAQTFHRIQEAAGKAKDNIRGLNRDFKANFPESVLEGSEKFIDLIAAGDIQSVTIRSGQRTIAIKKKGDRKISVKFSKKSEAELDA